MLDAFRRPLSVGISHSGITICRSQRGRSIPEVVAVFETSDSLTAPQALSDGLSKAFSQCKAKHGRVSIMYQQDFGRDFEVTAPINASSMADLNAACALKFRNLFDESIESWTIRADWSASQPFHVHALPASWLGSLLQCQETLGLQITSIRPHVVGLWDALVGTLRTGDWIAVVNGDVAHFAVSDQTRLRSIFSTRMPNERSNQRLTQLVQMEILRRNLPTPANIHWVGRFPGNEKEAMSQEKPWRIKPVEGSFSDLATETFAGPLAHWGCL